MIRTLTVVVLIAGATLAGGRPAPADDPPKLDGVARLRAFGRPIPGGGSGGLVAYGTVTAADDRSVTIRSWFELGIDNAKEEDESGTGRFGLRVRNDPTKPIVLSDRGWTLDCHAVRYTPEGMVVTVLSGQEVLVKNADLPARRFPAAPELLRGDPHPANRRQCHLPREVKVGDEVYLVLDGPRGKEECVGVTIHRRPGGRVPHSTVAPERFRPIIDRYNAYQDHEEYGTPIPDRFRRDLASLRREGILRDEAPPPPKRP
ncbi:hypothetical protein J0H58_30875 [bacterium]|nr:hypothetical protein [bacterium]